MNINNNSKYPDLKFSYIEKPFTDSFGSDFRYNKVEDNNQTRFKLLMEKYQ